jgi:hypothetical protein
LSPDKKEITQMASTQKAYEMASYLKEELALRLPSQTVALTLDTTSGFEGCPVITVYEGAAASSGDNGCLIRVQPISWALAKDVLGNASQVYTPHEILVGFEGLSVSEVQPCPAAQKAPILMALGQMGAAVKVYEIANGNFFAVTDFIAANLKATYQNLKYPMVISQ